MLSYAHCSKNSQIRLRRGGREEGGEGKEERGKRKEGRKERGKMCQLTTDDLY
jgi:hypothetical protein